ncbi:reverse transcriptase domain-containing protein [Commensalibacter communis]|uniref:reverse transcriptase domain-containing protein n=1 Tax=Commensalibacter communis TaxID=2972786 RepID=UPI0022FF8CF4|nr:reverse transcriptase domain-containing protein [Commensalibacter communis]CAI3938934.1 unnamed protein product [Commensalibacter communis]CAI3939268.1 unnamed protein product [Commensalibacter communis]
MVNDFLISDDMKNYPHFDNHIFLENINKLVTDPQRVAKHCFYPFIQYELKRPKFRKKPKPKSKPEQPRRIRYAARGDAYIFKYYRSVLSELYEQKLIELGIQNCPIAYRRIPRSNKNRNKCNIDFAKDAFDEIDKQGNCVAIALDIEGYFESLDHQKIKEIWCKLLGVDKLGADHYAIFKNITQYRYVEQDKLYERLGYTKKRINPHTKEEYIVHKNYKEIPRKLCSNTDFREKICGKDSIIQKNQFSYGIPQGAPISDLIANFYLLDFDLLINKFVLEKNGRYMRYSDDILIIIPGGEDEAQAAIRYVEEQIKNFGNQLQIKTSKTCAIQFKQQHDGSLQCNHLKQFTEEKHKEGLEYLGFRYDGCKVYIRNSTISHLYRKVSKAVIKEVLLSARRFPDLNESALLEKINYHLIKQSFAQMDKRKMKRSKEERNFYSYLKTATDTFGYEKGDCIIKQINKLSNFIKRRIEKRVRQSVIRKRIA